MIGPPQFCQHPLAQGCEWTVKDRQTKSCSGVCHVDAAAIGAQTGDCRSNACESVRLAACVLDEQAGEIARETRRRIEIGEQICSRRSAQSSSSATRRGAIVFA
ncbi:hypothetical protein [Burkholderia anthina]|uniref:hypothetical protein n=1 Tax=Burkholderia anthina TaxID=179879 RepID=UPI0012DA1D3D